MIRHQRLSQLTLIGKNIFLQKKIRLDNHLGIKDYDDILLPIANELKIQKRLYPMTIIYMRLKYCAHAYNIFEKVLAPKQYVVNDTHS